MDTGRDGNVDGERAGEGVGDVDVCVVGAGPVGLTLAIGLRRLGLRVRIVDKAPATKREARALVLWARAREALDSLGVGETLRRHGVELEVVTIHARDRALGELTTGWARSAHARPLNIEQHDIERLLSEELARLGTRVEWNTELTDVKVHDDRAEFTLRHEDGTVESAVAPWIVGCEGTASVVRDRLGIPFEGRRRTGLQVVQGNAHPSWQLGEEPGRGHIFLAPHRSLLVFPLPGGGFRFFCFRDDPDPTLTTAPTIGELRDLVAETAGMPGLRLEATEHLWLNRARFSDRVAARLRSGRGLLAGDAAHAWAPVGGHGMNVGVLGAHNLAWKLAAVHRGQAGEELLDTYSDEQRLLAVRYIREMRFNFMELPLPPLGYRAFTATVPAALARRGIQRRLDLRLSDLVRNHRDGALSRHRPGRRRHRGGPRAGDRMPDVALATGSAEDGAGTGPSGRRGRRGRPAALAARVRAVDARPARRTGRRRRPRRPAGGLRRVPGPGPRPPGDALGRRRGPAARSPRRPAARPARRIRRSGRPAGPSRSAPLLPRGARRRGPDARPAVRGAPPAPPAPCALIR
ncbi:FAD-dependent monooxygenase [Streptomyces exfoliatus]|uniref:FAD-dependent monooxygenase n=1 Tax=Streptomyces exfoliatus TaxID=1905 RepID=UPI0018E2EBB7|nr:FAD-dependent monooxygenase [Streptomyces exfoliatus]